jgi:hypothetical protein
MTVGPVLTGLGALLLTRVGGETSYVTDVLPGVLVLGTGMTLTVAPLTATALSSVPDGSAGVASGVNNAVARTAGLVAVAVAPLVVGLSGREYEDAAAIGSAFDGAMVLVAGLALTGAAVALVGLRGTTPAVATRTGSAIRVDS